MMDGELGAADSDEDDDIARFERQCAERAKAQGLEGGGDEASDDEDARCQARAAAGHVALPSAGDGGLERKCAELQSKLARKEADLMQARGDIDMLKTDTALPGDMSSELKQRLIEMTKKNRALKVTLESQKTRLQQLETEVKKPKEEARRQAEEAALQHNNNAMLGEGLEDWKKKYLTSSNKLQEVRLEVQELRVQVQKQKKVLLKEIGAEEAIEKALAAADDPASSQWKGRAAQISQLQRQVREFKDQLKRPSAAGAAAEDMELGGCGAGGESPPRMARPRVVDAVAEKGQVALKEVAEKRRQEFESLQEEVERLRGDQAEGKRKREALKSRVGMLEPQLRELKAHVQTLLKKSDDDDALFKMLRRQLGREGEDPNGLGEGADAAAASEENAELRDKIERQAQMIRQLKQQNMANTVENGSVRLGPKSVEAATGERQLIERVRFLEAEELKYKEQVRLLQQRGGDDSSGAGRPYSSESLHQRKATLRQMDERFAMGGSQYRGEDQRIEDPRSSPSCGSRSSTRSGPMGGMGGSGLVAGIAS